MGDGAAGRDHMPLLDQPPRIAADVEGCNRQPARLDRSA
jgi:hypothetical protein